MGHIVKSTVELIRLPLHLFNSELELLLNFVELISESVTFRVSGNELKGRFFVEILGSNLVRGVLKLIPHSVHLGLKLTRQLGQMIGLLGFIAEGVL